MSGHRGVWIGTVVLGLAAFIVCQYLDRAEAGGEISSDKIAGTWTLTKINGKDPGIPEGYVFTSKGEVRALTGIKAKGTYTLTGDKLTMKMMLAKTGFKGKKGPVTTLTTNRTITSITDDTMVMNSIPPKHVYEFKREK